MMRSAIPAALLACLATACAPTPQRHPGVDGWRLITETDATTTSRCIGRPYSPFCAVETLLACFQRGQLALCRMVDDDTDQYAQAFDSPPRAGRWLYYREVAVQMVGPGMPLPQVLASHAPRPGDVLVSIDQVETDTRLASRAAPARSHFLLRRQDNGAWTVIGWGDPGD